MQLPDRIIVSDATMHYRTHKSWRHKSRRHAKVKHDSHNDIKSLHGVTVLLPQCIDKRRTLEQLFHSKPVVKLKVLTEKPKPIELIEQSAPTEIPKHECREIPLERIHSPVTVEPLIDEKVACMSLFSNKKPTPISTRDSILLHNKKKLQPRPLNSATRKSFTVDYKKRLMKIARASGLIYASVHKKSKPKIRTTNNSLSSLTVHDVADVFRDGGFNRRPNDITANKKTFPAKTVTSPVRELEKIIIKRPRKSVEPILDTMQFGLTSISQTQESTRNTCSPSNESENIDQKHHVQAKDSLVISFKKFKQMAYFNRDKDNGKFNIQPETISPKQVLKAQNPLPSPPIQTETLHFKSPKCMANTPVTRLTISYPNSKAPIDSATVTTSSVNSIVKATTSSQKNCTTKSPLDSDVKHVSISTVVSRDNKAQDNTIDIPALTNAVEENISECRTITIKKPDKDQFRYTTEQNHSLIEVSSGEREGVCSFHCSTLVTTHPISPTVVLNYSVPRANYSCDNNYGDSGDLKLPNGFTSVQRSNETSNVDLKVASDKNNGVFQHINAPGRAEKPCDVDRFEVDSALSDAGTDGSLTSEYSADMEEGYLKNRLTEFDFENNISATNTASVKTEIAVHKGVSQYVDNNIPAKVTMESITNKESPMSTAICVVKTEVICVSNVTNSSVHQCVGTVGVDNGDPLTASSAAPMELKGENPRNPDDIDIHCESEYTTLPRSNSMTERKDSGYSEGSAQDSGYNDETVQGSGYGHNSVHDCNGDDTLYEDRNMPELIPYTITDDNSADEWGEEDRHGCTGKIADKYIDCSDVVDTAGGTQGNVCGITHPIDTDVVVDTIESIISTVEEREAAESTGSVGQAVEGEAEEVKTVKDEYKTSTDNPGSDDTHTQNIVKEVVDSIVSTVSSELEGPMLVIDNVFTLQGADNELASTLNLDDFVCNNAQVSNSEGIHPNSAQSHGINAESYVESVNSACGDTETDELTETNNDGNCFTTHLEHNDQESMANHDTHSDTKVPEGEKILQSCDVKSDESQRSLDEHPRLTAPPCELSYEVVLNDSSAHVVYSSRSQTESESSVGDETKEVPSNFVAQSFDPCVAPCPVGIFSTDEASQWKPGQPPAPELPLEDAKSEDSASFSAPIPDVNSIEKLHPTPNTVKITDDLPLIKPCKVVLPKNGLLPLQKNIKAAPRKRQVSRKEGNVPHRHSPRRKVRPNRRCALKRIGKISLKICSPCPQKKKIKSDKISQTKEPKDQQKHANGGSPHVTVANAVVQRPKRDIIKIFNTRSKTKKADTSNVGFAIAQDSPTPKENLKIRIKIPKDKHPYMSTNPNGGDQTQRDSERKSKEKILHANKRKPTKHRVKKVVIKKPNDSDDELPTILPPKRRRRNIRRRAKCQTLAESQSDIASNAIPAPEDEQVPEAAPHSKISTTDETTEAVIKAKPKGVDAEIGVKGDLARSSPSETTTKRPRPCSPTKDTTKSRKRRKSICEKNDAFEDEGSDDSFSLKDVMQITELDRINCTPDICNTDTTKTDDIPATNTAPSEPVIPVGCENVPTVIVPLTPRPEEAGGEGGKTRSLWDPPEPNLFRTLPGIALDLSGNRDCTVHSINTSHHTTEIPQTSCSSNQGSTVSPVSSHIHQSLTSCAVPVAIDSQIQENAIAHNLTKHQGNHINILRSMSDGPGGAMTAVSNTMLGTCQLSTTINKGTAQNAFDLSKVTAQQQTMFDPSNLADQQQTQGYTDTLNQMRALGSPSEYHINVPVNTIIPQSPSGEKQLNVNHPYPNPIPDVLQLEADYQRQKKELSNIHKLTLMKEQERQMLLKREHDMVAQLRELVSARNRARRQFLQEVKAGRGSMEAQEGSDILWTDNSNMLSNVVKQPDVALRPTVARTGLPAAPLAHSSNPCSFFEAPRDEPPTSAHFHKPFSPARLLLKVPSVNTFPTGYNSMFIPRQNNVHRVSPLCRTAGPPPAHKGKTGLTEGDGKVAGSKFFTTHQQNPLPLPAQQIVRHTQGVITIAPQGNDNPAALSPSDLSGIAIQPVKNNELPQVPLNLATKPATHIAQGSFHRVSNQNPDHSVADTNREMQCSAIYVPGLSNNPQGNSQQSYAPVVIAPISQSERPMRPPVVPTAIHSPQNSNSVDMTVAELCARIKNKCFNMNLAKARTGENMKSVGQDLSIKDKSPVKAISPIKEITNPIIPSQANTLMTMNTGNSKMTTKNPPAPHVIQPVPLTVEIPLKHTSSNMSTSLPNIAPKNSIPQPSCDTVPRGTCQPPCSNPVQTANTPLLTIQSPNSGPGMPVIITTTSSNVDPGPGNSISNAAAYKGQLTSNIHITSNIQSMVTDSRKREENFREFVEQERRVRETLNTVLSQRKAVSSHNKKRNSLDPRKKQRQHDTDMTTKTAVEDACVTQNAVTAVPIQIRPIEAPIPVPTIPVSAQNLHPQQQMWHAGIPRPVEPAGNFCPQPPAAQPRFVMKPNGLDMGHSRNTYHNTAPPGSQFTAGVNSHGSAMPRLPVNACTAPPNVTVTNFTPSMGQVLSQYQGSYNALQVCCVCSREASFICAGCQAVWYCSNTCQETSWDKHRLECNAN